jgi:sugar-specific transcriptional regulator TrmB
MDTKNILKPLSEIGLSKYEAKVYLTLISEGISAAKDISNITGIPYGKVYEIMNTLSQKGFAMVLPSKPMKYMAVSPHQAITATNKEVKNRFEKIESTIISQLEPLFAKNKNFSEQKGNFSIINGRSNVVSKTEELIKKAKNKINIQCSANSLSRLILHKDILKEAAERGVKISIAGITNKENLEEIKSLDFCDLKHISKSANNLISSDGKESIVFESVPDDDNILYGRDIGIHAQSSSFTRFLDNFFELNLNKAKKMDLSSNKEQETSF